MQGLHYVFRCFNFIISSMSICIVFGSKGIMVLVSSLFSWLLVKLSFVVKQWNNIVVLSCWFWGIFEFLNLMVAYIF